MYEIALLRRKQKITPQKMAGWANTIRLMEQRDGISLENIYSALDWYRKHWNDSRYIPVIESATALREKWGKLVDAMEKAGANRRESEWI